jgi:anthranilate synthase/aminodeoxychorismate synthase-like glutamine amidotransferase
MILVIDNYDSFTFNLVQALEAAGAEVRVIRNDAIDRAGIEGLADDQEADLNGIVVSPGPSDPDHAGVSMDAVRVATEREIPLLGVCLGHQAVVQAYGGEIGQAQALVHGKASRITHDGRGVFGGLPEELEVGRYHSLAATTVPDALHVTARTADGEVMGVRHVEHPVEGVQFHPESVLTPLGARMAENFLS